MAKVVRSPGLTLTLTSQDQIRRRYRELERQIQEAIDYSGIPQEYHAMIRQICRTAIALSKNEG